MDKYYDKWEIPYSNKSPLEKETKLEQECKYLLEESEVSMACFPMYNALKFN